MLMSNGKFLAVGLLGLAAWLPLLGHGDEPKPAAAAQKKVSALRLQGMKEALVDLEKGLIKQKDYNDRPDSRSWRAFAELMTKECGVVWEWVKREKVPQDELGGYNDVMRVEIEHRFGRGIIEKLEKKAEEQN
jgi:hypothetical protein